MSFHVSAVPSTLAALGRVVAASIRTELFRTKIRSRFPGVHFDWPINFVIDDLSALSFGTGAVIGPYSEIIVLKKSPCSCVAGGLHLAANVHIGMGANIRAAGGLIHIGKDTQIGQHVSIIGSNHYVDQETSTVCADKWDELKTGVTIGDSCWIGSNSIILPGVTLGKGAVIGAGSVVTRAVGTGEIWFGNPARPASAHANVK